MGKRKPNIFKRAASGIAKAAKKTGKFAVKSYKTLVKNKKRINQARQIHSEGGEGLRRRAGEAAGKARAQVEQDFGG